MKNTKIIAIEGMDGAGKSFIISSLKNSINLNYPDLKIYYTREPGGSPSADAIRELVLNKDHQLDHITETMLMAASRIEHCKKLQEIIDSGEYDYIITDRFLFSSIAYQGYGHSDKYPSLTESINEVLLQNRHIMNYLNRIDLMIVVTANNKVREERLGGRNELDRIELMGDSFTQRVNNAFSDLFYSKIETDNPTVNKLLKDRCLFIDNSVEGDGELRNNMRKIIRHMLFGFNNMCTNKAMFSYAHSSGVQEWDSVESLLSFLKQANNLSKNYLIGRVFNNIKTPQLFYNMLIELADYLPLSHIFKNIKYHGPVTKVKANDIFYVPTVVSENGLPVRMVSKTNITNSNIKYTTYDSTDEEIIKTNMVTTEVSEAIACAVFGGLVKDPDNPILSEILLDDDFMVIYDGKFAIKFKCTVCGEYTTYHLPYSEVLISLFTGKILNSGCFGEYVSAISSKNKRLFYNLINLVCSKEACEETSKSSSDYDKDDGWITF